MTLKEYCENGELRGSSGVALELSLFKDRLLNQPGSKQMVRVAKTIAALMNTDGGRVCIGVADDGSVVGMKSDFYIMVHMSDLVTVRLHNEDPLRRRDDAIQHYGMDDESYKRKIHAIVKAFLSENAVRYLSGIHADRSMGETVYVIDVKPCRKDEIVYVYSKPDRHGGVVCAEIYIRDGAENRRLDFLERDDFVRSRTLAYVNMIVGSRGGVPGSTSKVGENESSPSVAVVEPISCDADNQSAEAEAGKVQDFHDDVAMHEVQDYGSDLLFSFGYDFDLHRVEVRYNVDNGGNPMSFQGREKQGELFD